ncbi:MAG TPA: potassium channel family protein [Planctomycetota bacterium]|nr:potassium channel family protein [Planctomycetota bacterium]
MRVSAESNERGSLPVLIALGVLFVLEALATEASRLVALAYALVLIGSAWAMTRDRRHVLRTVVLLAVALAARLAHEVNPGRVTLLLAHATGVVFLAWSAALLFRHAVAAPGRVNQDRILGAVCVYLMLGVIGAAVASSIAAMQQGAFRFPEGMSSDSPYLEVETSSFLYFSFVTLATLGYGDITPVTPLARTFSWILAVTGQMYIAIVVARLASLWFSGTAPDASGRTDAR